MYFFLVSFSEDRNTASLRIVADIPTPDNEQRLITVLTSQTVNRLVETYKIPHSVLQFELNIT